MFLHTMWKNASLARNCEEPFGLLRACRAWSLPQKAKGIASRTGDPFSSVYAGD